MMCYYVSGFCVAENTLRDMVGIDNIAFLIICRVSKISAIVKDFFRSLIAHLPVKAADEKKNAIEQGWPCNQLSKQIVIVSTYPSADNAIACEKATN